MSEDLENHTIHRLLLDTEALQCLQRAVICTMLNESKEKLFSTEEYQILKQIADIKI